MPVSVAAARFPAYTGLAIRIQRTAIDAAQAQAVMKDRRMLARVGFGLEALAQQFLEDDDGQEGPALGEGAIGELFPGEFLDILGQSARLNHAVENQAFNQLDARDHRRTPVGRAVALEDGINGGGGEGLA